MKITDKDFNKFYMASTWQGVSAHRIPHLRHCQTLEVQEVRLRVLRLVSAALCEQIQENLHGLIEKLRYGVGSHINMACNFYSPHQLAIWANLFSLKPFRL